MTDVVDAATRSRMMSAIRSKNTKPELNVRTQLHRLGLRFTLGNTTLPGKPDLAFPRHKAVIFVNGCFWHCHRCNNFRWPSSNTEFWRAKLLGTIARDKRDIHELGAIGWRVLVIWECAVRHANKQMRNDLYMIVRDWVVNYDSPYIEISKGQGDGYSKRKSTSRSI